MSPQEYADYCLGKNLLGSLAIQTVALNMTPVTGIVPSTPQGFLCLGQVMQTVLAHLIVKRHFLIAPVN